MENVKVGLKQRIYAGKTTVLFWETQQQRKKAEQGKCKKGCQPAASGRPVDRGGSEVQSGTDNFAVACRIVNIEQQEFDVETMLHQFLVGEIGTCSS